MAAELHRTLSSVRQGQLRARPWYQSLPAELLQLRHVALSGDGEPTLAPNFVEAVQAVVRVRALGGFLFQDCAAHQRHRTGPARKSSADWKFHQVG